MLRKIFSVSVLSILFSTMVFAKVYVNVSVDWEGREVSEENIKSMESFRQKFPHVPLLHFLNAAYFTKEGADAEQTKSQIRRVINKDDELGLHIHAWKSLVKAAGVEYRSSPSWSRRGEENCEGECGHGVPLWAYKEKELRKIISFSLDVLEGAGFGRAQSFRSGGWMSSRKVLKALTAEGIKLDASAVPREFLASSQPVITRWVDEIWPGVNKISQPYLVRTEEGEITEFPNNGCLADYMTGRMMLSVFKDNIRLWSLDKDKDIFVSIGFHHETASYYLPQLERALELIEAYVSVVKAPMEYKANILKVL